MRRRIVSRSGAVLSYSRWLKLILAVSTAAAVAATTSTTAVESAPAATMEATSDGPAATVIELRVMPAAIVMPFPRMVNVEAGTIAPAISPTPTQTIGVRPVAIRRVISAVITAGVIAAAGTAGDCPEQ